MKKLTQMLTEMKKNAIVVSFGRMNPMTNGHEKLVNKIKSEAASRKADAKLYLSHSTNAKKDPLAFDVKVKYAKKAFGSMVQNSAARTIIEVAKELTGKYSTLVVVVGSDRVPEFKTLLNRYNGKDFSFDSIEVISAGERDPDAEGVEGMSASKMRGFASANDFDNFKKGVPSKLADSDAKALFDAVRNGMKLNEEFEIVEAISDSERIAKGKSTSDDVRRKYYSKMVISMLGGKDTESQRNRSWNRYQKIKSITDPDQKNEEVQYEEMQEDQVDEAVLSLSQRRKRGMQLRRMKTRIQRARMIAMRRFADKKRLQKRARRAARNALRKRFSSSTNYSQMGVGQKIAVDKRLDKMKPVVGKIATRLMPAVRRKEVLRKQRSMKNESLQEATKTTTSRLDQLIRLGLADKAMLATIKRAMMKLDSGDTLNPSERKAAESLVSTLVDIVTSSDSLYRMTKGQLQKENFIIHKADAIEIKEEDDEDDVDMDGISMAKIELSAIIEDADELLNMLDEMEEEPEAWVQSKITLATDYISSVRDYLEFYAEDEEDEEDEEEDDMEYEAEEVIRQMPKEELEEFADMFEDVRGLDKKSEKSGIPYSILKEVYDRGIASYEDSPETMTREQWAFARVNAFILGKNIDRDLAEKVLEWGTDETRMAYARATPGQSQEITDVRYSAEGALKAINNANLQRMFKMFSEEACCDECKDEIVEEVDWDLVLHEAEYQGKEVSLNKPFYTPDGPKKSAVYTMGPNGKVVIVRFGDPNMEIKRDNPERRASFRARHNCDDPGPKWKARYWSCKAW